MEYIDFEIKKKEIIDYIYSTIDSDSYFIDGFPRFHNDTNINDWIGAFGSQNDLINEYRSIDEERQLDWVYSMFKQYVSTQTMMLEIPKNIKFSNYIPSRTLSVKLRNLSSVDYQSMSYEEKTLVWINKVISTAFGRLLSILQLAYSNEYKAITPKFDIKKLSAKQRSFELDAEEFYYKSVLPQYPPYHVEKLITTTRNNMEAELKLLITKSNVSNSKSQYLNDSIVNVEIDTVSLSFGVDWYEEGRPRLDNIKAISKWWGNMDYEKFIRLLITYSTLQTEKDLYENKGKEIQVLNAYQKKKEVETKDKEEAILNKIKDWVFQSLTPNISPEDIIKVKKYIVGYILDNENGKITEQIKNQGELKNADLFSFAWVIWHILKGSKNKRNQNQIVDLIMEIFPMSFYDLQSKTKERLQSNSILNHLHDNKGDIIKIPKEYL